jgi:hypothetical protein
MTREQFEATEGLLQDVMTKQSGVVEKALLEAVMNSVDANAESINIQITEDTLIIDDDGDSMSQQEVEQYFKQFGYKDTDVHDKEFGKFRMGRGQIFNFGVNIWRTSDSYLVVNIHEEGAVVELPDCTQTESDAIQNIEGDTYTLDTSGLSFVMLDAEPKLEGLNVQVNLHETPVDVDEIEDELKLLVRHIHWVHDVDIKINGESVTSHPEVIEETDLAWYARAQSDLYTNAKVYNKGAHVDNFNLGPESLQIITKRDLDVTLDRTSILDSDEYWQNIQDEHRDILVERLLESDSLNSSERNWLIEQAQDDVELADRVATVPLLKDIDGDLWTIKTLSNKDVTYANQSDGAAQRANEEDGVVVLRDTHKGVLKEFALGVSDELPLDAIKEYMEVVQDSLSFEMSEQDEQELSKRRRKNLVRIRRALRDLGYRGEVKPGYSNHRDTWTDNDETLFIDKDFLNATKSMVATEVLLQVLKETAHDGDSRSEFNEDYALMRQFYRNVTGDRISADKDYAEVQRELLSGNYD